MKIKNILKTLPALFLLHSYGDGTARYEKTIADAVQTRDGVKYDLNFKVIEINELKIITVADSIRYLQQEFESKKEKNMAFVEESLKAYEMIASIGHDAETNLRIAGQKNKIDSLRNVQFTAPERYTAMAEGSVLASVVRCTYKIDIPSGSGKVTAEETFDFFSRPTEHNVIRNQKSINNPLKTTQKTDNPNHHLRIVVAATGSRAKRDE